MLDIQSNAERLAESIDEYRRLTGKGTVQILREKAARVSFALSSRLRLLAPAKGSIRQAAISRLRSGGGVTVRESVKRRVMERYGAASQVGTGRTTFLRGKKRVTSFRSRGESLNLQNLLVKAELSARESGRGFLGVSARYPKGFRGDGRALSKFGPALSEAVTKASDTTASLVFTWGGALSRLSAGAARGLQIDKAKQAVAEALEEVNEDILVYLARKNAENKAEAKLK